MDNTQVNKMAFVSNRTRKIMSAYNKKPSDSVEDCAMKEVIFDGDEIQAKDNTMVPDGFPDSVENNGLFILDIPEVTTGIGIQGYLNVDKANAITKISNFEIPSTSGTFYTLPNLDFVPYTESNIHENIELSSYEIELKVENPVRRDPEMETVIEDEHSEALENNGSNRTAEACYYSDFKADNGTKEHGKEGSLDTMVRRDKCGPGTEENKENRADINDPDFVPDFEMNDISENETVISTKRKKRHFVCSKDWNENKRRINRELGKEYHGRKKVDGKWKYDIKKDARKLREPCYCKPSIKGKTIKCRMFSEEERADIFTRFWSKMGWNERKVYISFLVLSKPTQRSRNRKVEEVSRRSESLIYNMKHNEKHLRVCKKMFLNTHCVKENMILDWIKQKNGGDENTKETRQEHEDLKMGRYKDMKDKLKHFFTKLPKMESHYCRASSTKLYLEPNWETKSSLYNFYKQWCKQKNYAFLSIASFNHVFDEMNLSLFRPKKDECDKCVAHKTGNLSDDEFNLHQDKKKEARTEKSNDKQSDNKVFCMDVQSVLLSPKSNVSSLYFKTKLKVHNMSFFDLQTKDGYCYIWHESAGGVSAQEYSSIICQFIKDHGIVQPGQTLIFYSDGCNSQNRNATLANGLINMSINLNITIEQKFLEKGHTQMEADSIHSTIERQIRNAHISVPADYVEIMMKARKKPHPYKVYYLDYGFFKDFSKLQFLKSLRPGKKVGDPLVTDIRALRYTPDSSVFYKLRHPEEFIEMEYSRLPKNKRTGLSCDLNNIAPLYNAPIPIKKAKYLDLQSLKKSLVSDYHSFYDNLPYK